MCNQNTNEFIIIINGIINEVTLSTTNLLVMVYGQDWIVTSRILSIITDIPNYYTKKLGTDKITMNNMRSSKIIITEINIELDRMRSSI